MKECLACQSVGQFNLCQFHSKRGTSFTLTFWDHCQQKTFCSLSGWPYSLSRGRNSSQYTSAKSTIQCFESIFSHHGIPRTIVSDNYPPFQGDETRQYMSTNGIKHRKITPIWPQANGEAKTFMKPLTKCL